jgi:predicted Ser/Thr protein kinase
MTDRLPGRATPIQPGEPARIGAYEVLGLLGRGGMGVVYLGRGPAREMVAIKVVRMEFARLPEFRARFRRETQSAMRVPRFCTAEVVAADPDAAQPYMVTEYIDGPTLKEVVRSGGPLRRAELDQLGVSMAAALTGIHAAGVVHRDLKPANVLLSRMGPRVIDFGIANAVDAARLTVDGQALGTPAYMAPEQLRGRAGPASDVFAWGGVMMFAATGKHPFGIGPLPALAGRIMYAEPDLSGLADPIRGIVADALAKDETRRPTPGRLLELMGVAGTDPALAVRTRLADMGLPDPTIPAGAAVTGNDDAPHPPPAPNWAAASRSAEPVGARAGAEDGAVTMRFGPGVRPQTAPNEAVRIWRDGAADPPRKGRWGGSSGGPGYAAPGGRGSGTRRSSRTRTRSIVSGLISSMIVGAVAAWLILQNMPGDLHATGLSVKAVKQEKACGDVNLTGRVTTNGEPGRLTYQWKLSDRRQPEAPRQINVSKGTKNMQLSFVWQFSGHGRPAKYTASLIVRGDNQSDLRDSATFAYACPG